MVNNTSSAESMPAVKTDGKNPASLTVVPPPKAKRTVWALNKRQQREVCRTMAICTVARKTDYAGALNANKIPPAFVTELENDGKATQKKSESALNCTVAKQGATAQEIEKKAALRKSLRCIQAAARNEYQMTNPIKLDAYLIGQRITSSKTKLESSAQTIIDRATVDLPGGITPAFLETTTQQLAAYLGAGATQKSELGQGKQDRSQRDAMVDSLIERRKKIQYAADTAWPPGLPGSSKARVEFQLPANRPFSY